MDDRLKAVAAIFDSNAKLFRGTMADMTETAWFHRPGDANHLAFLAMHLVGARHYTVKFSGGASTDPLEVYHGGARSIDSTARFPVGRRSKHRLGRGRADSAEYAGWRFRGVPGPSQRSPVSCPRTRAARCAHLSGPARSVSPGADGPPAPDLRPARAGVALMHGYRVVNSIFWMIHTPIGLPPYSAGRNFIERAIRSAACSN